MDSSDLAQRATRAASDSGVTIRDVESLEDIDRAIDVMIATWGPHQLVPSELFRALSDARDVVQAAWRGDRMVGFTLGFYGRDEDGWNLHSHMLAVIPAERSAGVGYALKLAQGAAAVADGVRRIRWTFDPILSRNAYFNLAKLGASADRFAREFYGSMPDDLNAGDRSDRLFVRWDLLEEADIDLTGAAALLERSDSGSAPEPATSAQVRDGLAARHPVVIQIPREYPDLRADDPGLARRWRDSLADALEACLDAGLLVRGFTADSEYLLA